MAKKKDSIVINKEPLSITVLGSTVEKKGNFIFLLVIFLLLFGAIFVYPTIAPYIERLIFGEERSTATEMPIEIQDTPIALVCKKDLEIITYNIDENGINEIIDRIEISTGSANYVESYLENINTSNTYQNQEGYSCVNKTNSDLISFTYTIDLAKADLSIAKSEYYYPLNTSYKKVKEELTKDGFSCSEAE